MKQLGAGDAVAAGGIVLASFTLLTSTGPGMAAVRRAEKGDEDFAAELRRGEVTSAIVVLVGTGVMSGLSRQPWPLMVGFLAVAVTVGLHEWSFADDALVDAPVPEGM